MDIFRLDEFYRPTPSGRLPRSFKHHRMQTGWLYRVYIGSGPRLLYKEASSGLSGLIHPSSAPQAAHNSALASHLASSGIEGAG